MKGKELRIKDLKDNQLVFLEFNFGSITQCELDTDLEAELKRLRKSYQDGLYKVNLKDKAFTSVTDSTIVLGFSHNLIDGVYEWIKCVCQDLKNDQLFTHIAHGDYNDLYIGKEYDEYWIEAQADGNVRKRIKYCPFCGRKLGED